MERTRELTTFAIDGYQISATFADSRNTTALGHVKQILLSSFANNAAKHTHGDILAIHPNRSDNNRGGSPYVPGKVHISRVLIRSFGLPL